MRAILLGLIALTAGCAATNTAAPPAADTGAPSAAYVARGNEPFWRLEADSAGARRITPEGEQRADTAPLPAPTPTVPGWRGFSTRFGGQTMTAEVTPGPCQDSMSGQFYPDRVRVQFGGETYTGCGGETLALLTGEWRAFVADQEIGTLTIAEDGALSGSAGCNRLMGTVSVTGEGIAIGSIASTRMMCAPEVMTRERGMIAALEASRSFSVEQDGSLRLSGPEGVVMTLRQR